MVDFANPFQQLPRASFNGAEFPVKSVKVHGGLRHHTHEYPHTPGGDPEKLGRKLYEIEMVAVFSTQFRAYPGLWPSRLALLRSMFEAGETGPLVIPTIGKVEAFATDWEQGMTSHVLTGEEATFKFMEDQSSAFLADKLISVKVETLDVLATNVNVKFADAGIPQSFADQILGLVNSVIALKDTTDVFLASQLANLARLCDDFNQQIEEFNDPMNFAALQALKEIWSAAQSVAQNVTGTQLSFGYYTVPRLMTATAVAMAIWGDSSRTWDVLEINPIQDAFAIPPGTVIKYIDDGTAKKAA